jgi:uncharacterized membrane protein YkvA (DUF1232 family)
MSESRQPRGAAGEGTNLPQIAPTPVERAGMLRALIENSMLTWRLLWDDRVSFLPKLLPILAIVYLVSPVDILPALVVGPLGALDDAGVMLLALSLFVQFSPPDVVREHRRVLAAGRTVRGNGDVVEGHAEVIDE